MESVQCNTWTTVTVTIRGTSRDKRYKEIGLESLQLCHRYRNLCSFCKFYIMEYPHHFSKLVPVRHFLHHQKYCKQFLFQNKTYFFQKLFFPSPVIEGSSLHRKIRIVRSFSVFKNSILKLIRTTSSNAFNCENQRGFKLIKRLHVSLSRFRKQKFKHSFPDTSNSICSCSLDVESTSHYVFNCSYTTMEVIPS